MVGGPWVPRALRATHEEETMDPTVDMPSASQ
jgi:hypothetical protein